MRKENPQRRRQPMGTWPVPGALGASGLPGSSCRQSHLSPCSELPADSWDGPVERRISRRRWLGSWFDSIVYHVPGTSSCAEEVKGKKKKKDPVLVCKRPLSGLSWWSMGWDLALSLPGPGVWSPVGQLRSHKPCCSAQKWKKKKKKKDHHVEMESVTSEWNTDKCNNWGVYTVRLVHSRGGNSACRDKGRL